VGLPQRQKRALLPARYETIAEAARCARSTVYEAISALEAAGILSWVHALKPVRVRCVDLLGDDGVRVVPQRTSNAYHFFDVKHATQSPADGQRKPSESTVQRG
jgi:hypothetical protein